MASIRCLTWTKTKWEDERYLRLILNEIGQIVSLDELNTTNKNKGRFVTTTWRPEDPTNYDTLKLQCQISSKTILLVPDEDLKSVLQDIDLKAKDWVVFCDPKGNILNNYSVYLLQYNELFFIDLLISYSFQEYIFKIFL